MLWDDDDTDFSSFGRPYVVSEASADDPYTAGVIKSNSCADQNLCEMVYYGFAQRVFLDDSSDAAAVDTHIGSSGTNAGNAGGYAAGADTCVLGTNIIHEVTTGGDNSDGEDFALISVWVDISCE